MPFESNREKKKAFMVVSEVPNAVVYVGPRPEGVAQAPAIQFVPTDFDNSKEMRIGTIVFDQEQWATWFQDKALFPKYATAEDAVNTLLKQPPYFLGCPICSTFRTKSRDEWEAHLGQHKKDMQILGV